MKKKLRVPETAGAGRQREKSTNKRHEEESARQSALSQWTLQSYVLAVLGAWEGSALSWPSSYSVCTIFLYVDLYVPESFSKSLQLYTFSFSLNIKCKFYCKQENIFSMNCAFLRRTLCVAWSNKLNDVKG